MLPQVPYPGKFGSHATGKVLVTAIIGQHKVGRTGPLLPGPLAGQTLVGLLQGEAVARDESQPSDLLSAGPYSTQK